MNNFLKKTLILSFPLFLFSEEIEYIPDTFLSLSNVTNKTITDIMDKNNSCSLFFENSIFCSRKSIKSDKIKIYLFNKENSQGTIDLKIVDFISPNKEEEVSNTKDKDLDKEILKLTKDKLELIEENKKLTNNVSKILEKNRIKLKECTVNNNLEEENKRLETEIKKISDLLKREKTKSKKEHFKLIKKLDELSKERRLFKENTQSEQVILLNTQLKNLLSENTNLKNQLVELKHSNKNLNTILKKKEEVIEQYKKMVRLQNANTEKKNTITQNKTKTKEEKKDNIKKEETSFLGKIFGGNEEPENKENTKENKSKDLFDIFN